jgi:hypothetical protein
VENANKQTESMLEQGKKEKMKKKNCRNATGADIELALEGIILAIGCKLYSGAHLHSKLLLKGAHDYSKTITYMVFGALLTNASSFLD